MKKFKTLLMALVLVAGFSLAGAGSAYACPNCPHKDGKCDCAKKKDGKCACQHKDGKCDCDKKGSGTLPKSK